MTTDPERNHAAAWARAVAEATGLPLTEERLAALAAAGGGLLQAARSLDAHIDRETEPATVFRLRPQP